MTDLARKIDFDAIKHLLSPRENNTHKGDFGHVLVIGGDQGFGGAALMTGESAIRTGAGLVSVATHPFHCAAMLARRPELMVKAVTNNDDLLDLIPAASVVVLGPGLGQSDWSRLCMSLTLEQLSKRPVPLVLDADALNLLSQGFAKEFLKNISEHILTPHPGEAGRLLKCSSEIIESDRVAAISKLQRHYGGICVLKGAGTLICYSHDDRQQIEQCAHGNPGMASGGMGDVLSGVLGGLLAQKYSLSDSARLGVCLHSKAADLQAEQFGERGLIATDLLTSIRALVNN